MVWTVHFKKLVRLCCFDYTSGRRFWTPMSGECDQGASLKSTSASLKDVLVSMIKYPRRSEKTKLGWPCVRMYINRLPWKFLTFKCVLVDLVIDLKLMVG